MRCKRLVSTLHCTPIIFIHVHVYSSALFNTFTFFIKYWSAVKNPSGFSMYYWVMDLGVETTRFFYYCLSIVSEYLNKIKTPLTEKNTIIEPTNIFSDNCKTISWEISLKYLIVLTTYEMMIFKKLNFRYTQKTLLEYNIISCSTIFIPLKIV